ncbi:hypothetical protein DM071_26435 [Klebsiella pneumoniae]|nr:hypothetical protein DM071_26435 [Klebsiella pneumoniae]
MPAGARNWPVSSSAKNPRKYCYFSRIKPCIHRVPVRPLSRRGLSPPMYLHENRPTKRAGEAGKALRASGKVFI